MSGNYRDKPHDVYWLYDAEGELLYVGCTSNLETRLLAHRRHPWFRSVARVEAKAFADYFEAREAESDVIWDENPKHNSKVIWRGKMPPIFRREGVAS